MLQTELVFGTQCDGQAWPETPGGSVLSIGSAVVGPNGLLAAVEHVLGTRQPLAPAVARIAAIRAKLASVPGERFWSRSFKADPWSTARLILEWRDELVAGGWGQEDHPTLSDRLRDMAAMEAVTPTLPAGFSDRCRAAWIALRNGGFILPWSALTLINPRDLLEPAIQTLVDAIEAAGVTIRVLPAPTVAPGDLGKLQRLMGGVVQEPLTGDGTVVVLHADTEVMAADALASWLEAGEPAGRTGDVFVLGASTGMLDDVLAGRGLPRFGHSGTSSVRAALQVLRLAFATRWTPFDPAALMELLLIPNGPLPGKVARILAGLLSETPGRGGPAWEAAIAECVAVRTAELERDGLSGRGLADALRKDTGRWQEWVLGDAFDPAEGIPAGDVLRTCNIVSRWAARAGSDDRLRMHAAVAASDLASAAAGVGEGRIPRALLNRMMDEAIGPGMADPAAVAEAADWSEVRHPGAVWGAADTVIWWAPGGAVAPRVGSWTEAEIEALAGCGCQLHAGTSAMALAARSWRQPILNATRRVVLVLSKTIDGGEADEHPLLHELAPLLRGDASRNVQPPGVVFRAETLLGGEVAIAGRTARREAVARRVPVAPARNRSVPGDLIRLPTKASASSIAKMLGCSFAWTLHYAGSVRPGSRASIPSGEKLLGLLAHAVFREIFVPGDPPAAATVADAARRELDRLLETEAAPLLVPGHASDLARARTLIPRASRSLAAALTDAGMRVVGTEIGVTAPAASSPLKDYELEARMDLVAEDARGSRLVIDMKWTKDSNVKYRREEVSKGRAVQLATYVAMQPSGVAATAGYFMLAQSEMLAADQWPFPGAYVRGSDLEATWQDVTEAWSAAVAAVARGELAAPGVGDDPIAYTSAIQIEPPCGQCGFLRLCGRAEAA